MADEDDTNQDVNVDAAEEVRDLAGDMSAIDVNSLPPELRPNQDSVNADDGPAIVTVTLDGQEYTLPEDQADNLIASWESRQDTQGADRFMAPAVEPEPEDDVDYSDLILTDPNKAVDMIEERITKKLRNEYSQKESGNRFWQEFYSENPDLNGYKDIVDITLSKHSTELGKLTVGAAKPKLAALTKERIMQISGGSKRQTTPKTTRTSGKGPSTQPAANADEDTGPKSLVEAIKERNEKRRASRSRA